MLTKSLKKNQNIQITKHYAVTKEPTNIIQNKINFNNSVGQKYKRIYTIWIILYKKIF